MPQPDSPLGVELTGCDKLLDAQLGVLAAVRTAYVQGAGILPLIEREIARIQSEKRERETRVSRMTTMRDEWGAR